MKILNWTTFILVVIGGLNWGLIGFFNFDLVAAIFGDMSALSRTIYALVGLSAVYMGVMGGTMMSENMMSGKMSGKMA
ncbi:MAG: DUF378 domain-containing protein [bacterium]|nr:DUF378 domain-containing protein [bacterium]